MIYLDSCVVISLTESDDETRRYLRQNISPHLKNGIAISELTRLECRVYPMIHQHDFLLNQYDMFFSQPDIKNIHFSVAVWDMATHIRAEHGLKVPDALHLAAAISGRCQVFCTCDKQLGKVADTFIKTLIPMPLQGEKNV